MPLDTKLRQVAAILAIPAVLLAIGAGYERGGPAGLRDLTGDLLRSVGLASNTPVPAAAPLPAPAAKTPSAALAPDDAFWLAIKDSRAPGLFEEFLKKFPESPHAQDARIKLQALQAAARSAGEQQAMPTPQRGRGPGIMMMGRGRGD